MSVIYCFSRLREKFHLYLSEITSGLKSISKGSRTAPKDINMFLNQFLFCLQPAFRSYIRIFSLDSEHNLDDTIFEAIINGKLNSIQFT